MMNVDAGRQHIRRLPDRPIVGETYPNAGGFYKVDRYDAERDLAWVHRPKDGWKCCAHGPALYDVPGRGTDAEVIAAVDTLIEGYMNCDDYGGSVAEDKGKSRIQVWHESLRNGVARRPASDNDLQLMLLRTSKPVRVGRRGVTLKLHGLELDFYTPELVNMRMKEKVYVRYDPEDLSSVRVYDMEDRFLCVAPQNKLTAGYLENQEQIADLMAAKRRAEKAVREYGAALRLPDDPDRALTLATALAQRNLDALDTFPSPKLIQLQQSAREEPLLKAVGDIDIGRMNENIIRQRGGIEDGKDL